jgi:23S rRNA pseudouridine1911/1915/1917 synthase
MSSLHAALEFKIVDETHDYLVVDKPPFLLTHPTKPDGQPTLWKELRELLAFEINNGGQVSIVNRLDRETSGLVLIAKTSAAARRFGLLMQQQRFQKEYLTIVWGWPEWETKIVDAPLDRQGKHRQWSRGDASDMDGRPERESVRKKANQSAIWLKQMIHPEGAPAQTEFFVERRFTRSTRTAEHPSPYPFSSRGEDEGEGPAQVWTRNSNGVDERFTLIRAVPRTGRTHQIRVHLASIRHPVVGDKIYGPDEKLYLQFIATGWTAQLEQQLLLPRHALHSTKLALEGEHEWTSGLPVDLTEFCSRPALPAAPKFNEGGSGRVLHGDRAP